MHLMFPGLVVTEQIRSIAEERFFSSATGEERTNLERPEQALRGTRKVGREDKHSHGAGHEQRFDARSWAEQASEDLAALVVPKTLGSDGPEAIERHEDIAELRWQREQLPALHLNQVAIVEQIEREAEKAIAEVESRNQ
jgi:hypothetical protein